jgi:hypothetical protein
MDLEQLLSDYDVVDVAREPGFQPFIVATPKSSVKLAGKNVAATAMSPDVREIGTASPSPFTSWIRAEYNSDLFGLQGLQKYDRMRRSDGTIRGSLRLVKTPVLAARWFIEPASQSKVDKTAAEFVWKNLTELMSISWPQVLTESMLMLDFGYYMFEKVWANRLVDGKVRTLLTKLAPRHPMDVREWYYDAHGGPSWVEMEPLTGDITGMPIGIPIEKLLVFTFDRECGNIEGMSILRSAYQHWYYKSNLYKIDAIQKERHGIGVPVIILPPGFNENDKAAAHELGRNLRTNERAHVVLPPNWKLEFADLNSRGGVVDPINSIQHHDRQIEKNFLATFIEGTTNEEEQAMFLKATRFIADIVCETFNLYVIPQMVDYNFMRAGYPKLRARRIGESADWRTLSFAIRNLVGAQAIVPDDKLEETLRDEMDLPPIDPETARKPPTPQAPGDPKAPEAGPPKQSPPSSQPPKNNGTDHSGG